MIINLKCSFTKKYLTSILIYAVLCSVLMPFLLWNVLWNISL
ncbi:MAG: DUF1270 family protein [Treponema sp.]|nr:DUF1270 family protein [Treponema sp.]